MNPYGDGDYPTTWDTNYSREYIQIDQSTLTVSYLAQGGQGTDLQFQGGSPACVTTARPVPLECPIYYFELEFKDIGETGQICFGFRERFVSDQNFLPGQVSGTYGYGAHNGRIFAEQVDGTPYGPSIDTGSVVGIILNQVDHTISFTVNGKDLGVAVQNLATIWLYPVLGLQSPGAQVSANFGGKPFRYDFNAIKEQCMLKLHQDIIHQTELASEKQVMDQLAFQYMCHNNFHKAAAAMAAEALGKPDVLSQEQIIAMQKRSYIRECIIEGKIQEARECCAALAPQLMTTGSDLYCKLALVQLLCLISEDNKNGGDMQRSLEYGRATFPQFSISSRSKEELQNALTLMAFPNPMECKHARLLSKEYRSQVADEVNNELKRCTDDTIQPVSALESDIKQLNVVHKMLGNGKDNGGFGDLLGNAVKELATSLLGSSQQDQFDSVK